jgi:hypothetical protein
MLNGTAAVQAKVLEYPVLVPEPTVSPTVEPGWLARRAADLQLINMEHRDQTKPTTGLYLNYSSVMFYLSVIVIVAGGWWWSWSQADKNGYERGKQESEIRRLQLQIEKATIDAQTALELSKKQLEAEQQQNQKRK